MSPQKLSLGRHKRACSICAHPQLAEIEADFVAWRSPEVIAREYGLTDRSSVYRHAHAFGLFVKRQRNIRAALERIIEQSGDVDVTASAVVAAIQAYAKINSNGQWIERTEQVNLNELFGRMSAAELDAYAKEGILPTWFEATVSAPSPGDVQGPSPRGPSVYGRLRPQQELLVGGRDE